MKPSKIRELASNYMDLGISVLPVRSNKRPSIEWAEFQEHQATAEQVNRWSFGRGGGLAWIMGEVSGNMEAMDFDFKHGMTEDEYEDFKAKVEDELPGITKRLLIQVTPSGGRHWIYRCDDIEGNQKLALNEDGEAFIETRGEGGYICVGPTENYMFENVNGQGIQIKKISTEDRLFLHNSARALSKGKVKKRGKSKFSRNEVPDFPSAFLEYNEDIKMDDLVEKDGWIFLDESDAKGKRVWRYQRPDQDEDGKVGASLYPDDNTFYIFSTAVGNLPSQQMMNAAEYIMYRDFDGDRDATVAWLNEQGYKTVEEHDQIPTSKKTKNTAELKVKRSMLNLIHDLNVIMKLRYNTIRRRVEFYDSSSKSVKTDPWRGVEPRFALAMMNMAGIKVNLERIKTALSFTSEFEHVDPIAQYLKEVTWDGSHRIKALSKHIKTKDQKRWEESFKKHLVRCVRQLLLEGVNRYALILHSNEQGNGKSTFIRNLIKAGPMKHYYSEDLPKENQELGVARFVSMCAHANIEELDGFAKKDADHLKALTTREDVSYRELFTSVLETIPRRVNFWGSTNKEAFLTDNRNTRWLIHEVLSIDWSYNEIDIDQVWAEAYHLYKDGYVCDLDKGEIDLNEIATKSFKREVVPEEWIFDVFTSAKRGDDGAVLLSPTEMMDDIINYYRLEEENMSVVRAMEKVYVNVFSTILREVGFEKTEDRSRGIKKKGFYVTAGTNLTNSKSFSDSHFNRAEESSRAR